MNSRLRLTSWLVLWCLSARAGAWELVVDQQNLQVERRPYAGSALMEIRGTTRLRASLSAIMTLLRDDAYNEHWVYRSGGARILRQDGDTRAWVYGVVDAPWPIADRDTVVRFDYRQAPTSGVITIDITNAPDFVPHKDPYIRVPDFGGFWQLRPQGDGDVQVIYQVRGDPGGWIPIWVANRAALVSVERTLRNMPHAVARYADATADYVREVDQTVNGE